MERIEPMITLYDVSVLHDRLLEAAERHEQMTICLIEDLEDPEHWRYGMSWLRHVTECSMLREAADMIRQEVGSAWK
jgi:hypothetical protein